MDNIIYLVDSLAFMTEPAHKINSITAISSYVKPWIINDENKERGKWISQTLEPYLSSSDERIRAAAVNSLHTFSGENIGQRLESAVVDPSLQVRLNAINVIGIGYRQSPRIRALLVESMLDSSKAPIERIRAFDVLKIISLSAENARKVSGFALYKEYELRQK